MASSCPVKPGRPISLQSLRSSDLFKNGSSIRVVGRLVSYNIETALAVVGGEGDATLVVNTRYLRDISFLVGRLYQFIGELVIPHNSNASLLARVGRNVDGMDLHLYHQSLLLLRQFEDELARSRPS
ncbi:telomere-capping, CST complex subunit isoform X2 [Wolffia australiana]